MPVPLALLRTAAGVAQRAALLAAHVDGPPHAAMWGLDGLDALLARCRFHRSGRLAGFVVAAHRHRGHDGSSITSA